MDRQFGGTEWIVYSCVDGQSIVIVSAEGNPASPFYFIYFPEGENYRLYGEGNGDKTYTQTAFEELKQLSSSDVQQIIFATKQRAPSGAEE